MEYLKSRPNGSTQVAQPQQVNSVTFASNSHRNPIIISTQRPTHITLKVHEMASPTDSFHSVVSSFHNEQQQQQQQRDGKVNLAYIGSHSDINNQPHSQHHQQNQSQHPR
jgi:hypothetical protein